MRILTTVQAGGSRAMVAGYVLGALLNGVLFAQILLYGGSKTARKTKPTRRITRAKLA